MAASELLRILLCPENRSPLAPADEKLLGELNAAAQAGQLMNRSGQPAPYPLAGALVRDDRAVAYPIVDGIPLMLVDEGILLDQLAGAP